MKINQDVNWLFITDLPHRILVISASKLDKTNALLNIIKHQRQDIDKNLFICQRAIRIKVSITFQWKRKSRDYRTKNLENENENWEDCYLSKKKSVNSFDDLIGDMEAKKKPSSIVNELLLKGRKINILLAFMSRSYFKVPKNI